MKINGLIENPKWKKVLVCTCKGKIDDCLHCKYSKAEESIPKNDFKIKWVDEKTKKQKIKTISDITVMLGRHDDVMGWTF